MKQTSEPFQFMAASTFTRVIGTQATTLGELLEQLRRISTDSVFNHTFQSLSTHHYLTEGFSNDFAQWVLASCNAPELAERLAAIDIRQYEDIESLRKDILAMLEEFVRANAQRAYQKAFEPFYFCEAVTVTVPTDWRAHNLAEFCRALEHISVHSLHYHFVTARLRGPRTNDFSAWMEKNLELTELADKIEHIDIYTNTLEGVRQLILNEVRPSIES